MRCACSVVLLLALGCGRFGYDSQGLAGADGGAPMDARAADAATDAGGREDSGLDAAPVDAGPPEVDGGTCDESPCRLVAPQCGCPAGQACRAGRVCALSGTGATGDTCSSSADCAAGLNCVRFGDRAPPGICRPFCATDAECTDTGLCSDPIMGEVGVGLCSFECNPITDAGCPTSLRCYVFAIEHIPDRATIIASACATSSGLPPGSACTRPRECGPGTTCVSTGGPASCREVCEPGAGGCGAGETCMALVPATILSGVTVGVCL